MSGDKILELKIQMNLNRHNYEEYFLLYADKELSADEKNRVEMFVQQNPDLKEEFIMLQEAIVKPDITITHEDKSSLFKKEEFINRNNYEEKLLLYTDNELNPSEIKETEKFVLSNSTLQKEFTLLQLLKYKADTSIVFPNKSMLYKKEEYAKVITFPWKAMAAAVLLGLGIWLGISYLQKNKTELGIVIKQNMTQKENAVKPVIRKDAANDIPLVKISNNQNTPPKALKKVFDNSAQKQHLLQQQNIVVKNIQSNNKPELNKIIEKKNDEVVVFKPTEKNETIKSNVLTQPGNNILAPVNKNVTSQSSNQTIVQPASYIADAEIKNENYVFYNITVEEFKKSKVGNFLKKVKRVIERKISLKDNSFNQ